MSYARIGFGADTTLPVGYVPANPFAVPLQSGSPQTRSAIFAAPADCGPGMTREPILGQCLPTGTDPTKCPPGMRYVSGKGCEFIPVSTGCPPGTTGDPAGISCWPINVPGAQPTPPTNGGGCPTGYVKDPVLGTTCIPTFWQVPNAVPGQGLPSAPGCYFGMVRDASGGCVWPICLPGSTFNVTTGGCEPSDNTGGNGYSIIQQACDLFPANLRPASCPAPTATTGTTPAANLSTICGLIPAGWPSLPGCPGAPSTTGPVTPITPGTLPPPVVPASSSRSGLVALALVAAVGGGLYYYKQKGKKGGGKGKGSRRGRRLAMYAPTREHQAFLLGLQRSGAWERMTPEQRGQAYSGGLPLTRADFRVLGLGEEGVVAPAAQGVPVHWADRFFTRQGPPVTRDEAFLASVYRDRTPPDWQDPAKCNQSPYKSLDYLNLVGPVVTLLLIYYGAKHWGQRALSSPPKPSNAGRRNEGQLWRRLPPRLHAARGRRCARGA